jgi:penicillin amidase
VNRGGFFVRNSEMPYRDVHGPGLRMVVDMAEPSVARFMAVPGESGNPLSPHYGDLVQPWRDGYGLALDGGRAVGVETLRPR